ncbi:MAG TPA: CpaF family protein [Vicinamibacterales bacterium]|jgi:pilus assembly protein CpaF|nr:CpaF family protein [Vicinamibacterales bacterium]
MAIATNTATTPMTAAAGKADLRRAQYLEIRGVVHRKLLTRLNLEKLATAERSRVEAEIRPLVSTLISESGTPLSLSEREAIVGDVLDEVFGFGPLEPLLRDSTVSDILVNTFNHVFVERRGKLERVPAAFQDDQHLLRVIDRIVSGVGRRIDDSSPMVDARLPDGSRVNAVIPPLAVDGPILSIRRFPSERLKAEDLVGFKALTTNMLEFLRHCVRARLNCLISGGTGAGKTTLLNVLSSFIQGDERIVTIEDAAELQLHQEHVVRLETRPPNVEGKGAIRQRQLVVNALRMRPDRIVVGEVRSEEALDMLQAMNTGHDGSLTTVHANTPRDALSRLETMIAMANVNLPDKAMRQQIAAAIQIVVQQARMSDGTRKVTSVAEITGMEGDVITMQEIFRFDKVGVGPDGRVLGRFVATGVRPKVCERLRTGGVVLPPDMFDGVVEVR